MDMINCYFPRLIGQTLGLNEDTIGPLLKGTALQTSDIYGQREMPISQFILFLNNALGESGDPALGLRFGQHAQPYLFGELAFAGINAPNLMDSLIGLVNYSALQASYVQFELQSDRQGLNVVAHLAIDLGPTERTQQEVMVLILQNYLELFLNRPFTEGLCRFQFDEPPYQQQYHQVLHSPFEFSAEHTQVFIPNQLLNTPSLFYDDVLWQQGKLKCAQKLSQLHDRYQHFYAHQVLSKLNAKPPPLPKLGHMAEQLNVSERTLNRRLQFEGTTFRQLYSQALHNWAQHYLLHSELSVENIATELGYGDSSNFRRAFKRHTGMSPLQFKETHQR